MYNSTTPQGTPLPSALQLARSTLIAAVAAAVLLVTVVLPAEYGIDPTGIGNVLRLTEMGRVKVQLAAEAAADRAATTAAGKEVAVAPSAPAQPATPASPAPAAVKVPVVPPPPAAPAGGWRDETRFSLAPGEGIEIKLRMSEGAKAQFAWVVDQGVVNYDTHGDGNGRTISYQKGRGVRANEGELIAAFTGNHGWFWRNRGREGVQVVLRTRGDYSELRRPK